MVGPLASALADTGHAAAAATGSFTLRVTYPGGLDVRDGLRLKPSQAASQPRVTVDGPGPFTLVMVDPDAPSPDAPKARSWLHWLVADCAPGAGVGAAGNGAVLCAYNGPTPPRGTHRYVFLVYEQAGGARVTAPHVEQRARFNAAEWAKAHAGAAAPAAAAFFLAAPEH
ncbi:MAG: PEBP-like protein [Monoraphidium minutum]|nr:MAG: PEBP-like protein [Monoraphidium minutum]